MAHLSYVKLPKNIDGEALLQQSKPMREIRLLSLQTDRSNFISRYEDEIDQPTSFWLDRLRTTSVMHFVAVDPSHEVVGGDTFAAIRYEAFLVFAKADRKQEGDELVNEFNVGAVYVRPEQRGKGVCTRLLQEGIKWASDDSIQTNVAKSVIYISVAEANISARRLYSKLGFEEVSRGTVEDKVGMGREVIRMSLVLF